MPGPWHWRLLVSRRFSLGAVLGTVTLLPAGPTLTTKGSHHKSPEVRLASCSNSRRLALARHLVQLLAPTSQILPTTPSVIVSTAQLSSKFSQTVPKTHLVLPKITTLNIPCAHVHRMFWNIPVCDYITDYVT